MIPKTGPISIEDFKKTHGCYVPGGNPEFGGASSSTAPFELSSIYTKNMIPYTNEYYIGDEQNMNDKRGLVACFNRDNYGFNTSFDYPGRTFLFYGNREGMTSIGYGLPADGAAGSDYKDPWGTVVRCILRGKATSSLPGGTNSSVMYNMCFYSDEPLTLLVKFRHRFTFSGNGPSWDPAPPSGQLTRQGTWLTGVEYADMWRGSNSNVVLNDKILSYVNANSADQSIRVTFPSSDHPYKLVSFQTTNHGHPTTEANDQFTSYWGRFSFFVV